MTKEEWKKIEDKLSMPFSCVKLKIDGYDVTVETQQDKPLHYVLAVYFHNYIYGKSEIRFIKGRLHFTDENENAAEAAPFPSMLVIYNGNMLETERKNYYGQ